MDLLFRNGKYQEIIDLYSTFCDRQLSFGKYPKGVLLVVFASYFKIVRTVNMHTWILMYWIFSNFIFIHQNTEEAMKSAVALWKKMNESGLSPLRRITAYTAALAVKHNNPHIALEILSTVTNQQFVLIRCLKVSIFYHKLFDIFSGFNLIWVRSDFLWPSYASN